MPRGVETLSAPAILALLTLSCGPQTAAQPTAPRGATTARSAPAQVASGWDYHPKTPFKLRARLTLEDGRWLFAGNRGERWLANPREATARTAAMLADEDLVAMSRPSSGGFAFVGSEGTVYLAPEPMGPFTQVLRASQKLAQVIGQGSTLLGVPLEGGLVRSSDGGRTYAPVKFEGGRIFDMAVAADGRAVILSAPEQLWESSDAGASFKLSATKSIGAMSAGLDASGDLVAAGLMRSVSWPKGAPGLQPLRGPIEPPDYDLMTDPKPGPSGAALVSGSATLLGTRYLEAVEPRKSGTPWTLIVSDLLGRARVETPITGSNDCARMLVSASSRLIVLGCLAGKRGTQSIVMPSLKLFVSTDGGTLFDSKPAGLVADERRARLRVLESGAVLVSGACRPASRRLCQVTAPIRIALLPGQPSLRFGDVEQAKAPPMPVQAIGLEVSPDAKRVYWAGRTTAGRALTMLVSDDDGVTFKPVALDVNRLGLGSADETRNLFESAQPEEIGVDEQGNVSWTLATPKGIVWLVLDREGRAVSARVMPAELPMIAAAGGRGLGFGARDGVVQFSRDGGATFEKLGKLPADAQVESGRGLVACRTAGCAMGASFSWQGWSSTPGGTIESSRPEPQPPRPNALTPIVCRVPDSPWNTIPRAERMVTAFEADRAGTAWSAIVRPRKRGAVGFAVARSTPKPNVSVLPVLDAASTDDVAVFASAQAEGVAAMRFNVDRDSDGEIRYGGALRNIEVGWVNLYEGGVRRGKLALSGVLHAEDASGYRTGDDALANASLLSVSTGGVYVCPHASCEGTDNLGTFIDLAGQTHPVSIPKWPTISVSEEVLSSRADMIRADGRDVPLSFVQETLAVARAHRRDGAFRFDAMTLMPQSARAARYRTQFSWALAESGLPNALAVTVTHPTEPAAYARIVQFRGADDAVGSVLPAPLQTDAGNPPRACTAADRKNSYRIVAPASAGRHHPIRVDIAKGKTFWLKSDDAVMFGKPGAGCISMFDTTSTGPGTMQALIDVSNLKTSWLFDFDGSESTLQWRTMECSFDPSAEPPESSSGTPESK